MNKFLVVEARRLLPLAFLLALLVSLSVYDNFFRLEPVDTPPPPAEEDFLYVTATRGELDAAFSFHLAHDQRQWEELQQNPDMELPDYPFNPSYEIALCTVNSQVEGVKVQPKNQELTRLLVDVEPSPQYYHLVMVNRDRLETPELEWVFLGEEGKVIHEEKVRQEENNEQE